MASHKTHFEDCDVLVVGGGIKTIEHIQKLLKAGADKVCINSIPVHKIIALAIQHPQIQLMIVITRP